MNASSIWRGWPGAVVARAVALLLVTSVCSLAVPGYAADDRPTIRVGVLQYGTVNWELAAMAHHGHDERHDFTLEVVPFAGSDATRIALLGGEVDIIVSDWLWVSRQRAEGSGLAFSPYSTSVGAIMVPGSASLDSLGELRGLTIGVAGGPLDKSWLLLQGHARQAHDLDLAAANEIVFAAPPLLAEQALAGDLDAMLNYWHYNARLEARGFERLISAEDAAIALGASGPTSAIGYVFDEDWATEQPELVDGFLAASRDTKALLARDDGEWQRLADSGVIRDDAEALAVLRDRFREGIPTRPLADEIEDARIVYRVLDDLAGEALLGSARSLVEGTYWQGGSNDRQ